MSESASRSRLHDAAILEAALVWGCSGFDGDQEAHGACQGSGGPVTTRKLSSANDNVELALAA